MILLLFGEIWSPNGICELTRIHSRVNAAVFRDVLRRPEPPLGFFKSGFVHSPKPTIPETAAVVEFHSISPSHVET